MSAWQIILLDHGLWIVPALTVVALVVFPWDHWDSILDTMEQNYEDR